MKTTGEISVHTPSAERIAEALSPDNGGFIECRAEGGNVCAYVFGESLRTIIATVDDYLMNLSVAEQLNEAAGSELQK
ncbi:MAG: KEOPS complex subunit Pcc1 [Methanocorpusculum sp.]|nr:KEOPS complex subunit Pcc1 [Methanocorpusculum sp.]